MRKIDNIKVYIGWDPRDYAAYQVAVASLMRHATIPVHVVPLIDRDLRKRGEYWRSYHVDHRGQMWDDTDGKPFSTQFSFTRFCVPGLEEYGSRWVLFTDADMMWRADIAELVAHVDAQKSLFVVKHDHRPREREKLDGVLQTTYERKNWSSVMLMCPERCRTWTKFAVNNWDGGSLHGLQGFEDDAIGELPEAWNWLEGHSSPDLEPKLVHYTRGTPDMEGHEGSAYANEWWGYYEEAANSQVVDYPLQAASA